MPANDRSNSQRSSQGVTSTSRSLIAGLRENEGEAWERLVRLYTPLVYYWCQKFDVSSDDIADIVQEVFKSVSQKIDSFRNEQPESTFRGWLRVITRNKAIDFYRRQSKQATAAGGTEAQHRLTQLPLPEFADDDEREPRNFLFGQALDAIRVEFRQQTWNAFWRVVVDDCTPAEVAAELQMTAGAVRVAKCRVLQRLRQELGDEKAV